MRKLIILITLLCALTLTSCKESVSVENRDFVDTIGVDIEKEEVTLTLLIPDPSKVANGSEDVTTVVIAKGENFTQAIKNADAQSANKLSLENARVIVVGEKLAKDEQKTEALLDAIKRNSVISKRIIVLIAKGNASDVLNQKVDNAPIFGEYLVDYYNQNPYEISSAYDKKLGKLISKLNLIGDAILPQIYVEEGKLNLDNGVLFSDGNYIDVFGTDILRGYALLMNKVNNIVIDVEMDNKSIPITIKSRKSKLTFEERNNKIVIKVVQDYNCSVTEFNGEISDDDIKTLSRLFNETTEKSIKKSYNYFVIENNSDVYGFEDMLMKDNFKLYSKYTNDATNVEFIRGLEFDVIVNSKIISTGSIK